MSISRTRQGLRRLTNLNPQTAFHDCFSYSENRYPRVSLDQRTEDASKALRRGFLKEREMEKYQKLGVCQTESHGIDGLADCEFMAVHDLLHAAQKASAFAKDKDICVDAFFEQLSARLKKDADLVPIHNLVAILQEFYKNNYIDLGLVNKIKNEFVYDIDRVEFPELAVVMHIFSAWNIVSPKLIKAGLKRAVEIEPEGAAICTILKSLKNCPNIILWKSTPRIGMLIDRFSASVEGLTFPEIASTISVLQYLVKRGVKIPSLVKAIDSMLSKSVTDVESAAEALAFCSKDHITVSLLEAVKKYVPTLAEAATPTNSVDNIETLETRNRAVNLAASLLANSRRFGYDDLVIELSHAITDESVRGLQPRQLVEVVHALSDSPKQQLVIDELKRKQVSLGRNLSVQVKKFL